jgi:hypothetical protein
LSDGSHGFEFLRWKGAIKDVDFLAGKAFETGRFAVEDRAICRRLAEFALGGIGGAEAVRAAGVIEHGDGRSHSVVVRMA